MLAVSIFDAMLRNFVLKNKASPILTPEERGCAFFKTLRLMRLNSQQRSHDPIHTANIESMRVTDSRVFPITPKLIAQYKEITADDVKKNRRWEIIAILVLLNSVRQEINRLRIRRFALVTGQPIIMWRYPLCGKQAASLSAEEKELLYSTHPSLTGVFIHGMPCTCLDNINPRKGLCNGARLRLHSLTLDPREDLESILRMIRKANDEDVIALNYPPISMNVEVIHADLSRYSAGDTLVPGSAVVPIFMNSRSRFEPVKNWETLNRMGMFQVNGVRYRSHGVEPEFACTFEKAQSKTLDGVIIDLSLWPGMHLTFEKVYVALTRVKLLEDIRLMPTLAGQSLDHLFSLQPDPRMLVWSAGFGPDGMWDAERCKAAMDQLPNEFFKKRKPNCPFRKWKASFQPSSSKAHSSKSSGEKTNCDHSVGKSSSSSPGKDKTGTGKDKSAMGNVSPAVTAIFRLDHPIQQSRAKVFRAFHIPPDGDCLFCSVKTLLNLPIPVAELRTQVVDFMDGLSPVEQVNIINEHLLRDPAWQNEQLFGPQGIFDAAGQEVIAEILLDSSSLADVHSDRFTRLWRRYKIDMSHHSWGGNAELGAIKDLYFVNIIVWQIDGGIARQVNRVLSGRADSSTLHLRWLDEKHFETTDVPPTYVPLPTIAPARPMPSEILPAVRVSVRERRPCNRLDL